MLTPIYLASFPRSGNTWVRFLIANLYNQLRGSFAEIDFFNVHGIVPELTKSGQNKEPHFKDLPLVVKTHFPFRETFNAAMLLVRNPFDVLYSYRDFLAANKGLPMSLAETARHETYGIPALVEHAESYFRKCPRLLILKYEDLQRRPAMEMRRICGFIGLAAGPGAIQGAVRRSSFAAMRECETRKGRQFGRSDFQFVRRGKVGEGEREFRKDKELYRYMTSQLKGSPLLDLFYGR